MLQSPIFHSLSDNDTLHLKAGPFHLPHRGLQTGPFFSTHPQVFHHLSKATIAIGKV